MSTKMIDVMEPATPHAQRHAAEIQPYGHLVRLPIALSETVCRDSVEHLNQLLLAEHVVKTPFVHAE